MYNDNCKQEVCAVPVPVDSMKNVILEIHDHAMKAKQMAFDIHKTLFGTILSDRDVVEDKAAESALGALFDINGIERETLEILYAVIEKIGD